MNTMSYCNNYILASEGDQIYFINDINQYRQMALDNNFKEDYCDICGENTPISHFNYAHGVLLKKLNRDTIFFGLCYCEATKRRLHD